MQGFLAAAFLRDEKPTDRTLIANIAYRTYAFPNRIVGGFGAGAADVPSTPSLQMAVVRVTGRD
jgi:hypothetical protein